MRTMTLSCAFCHVHRFLYYVDLFQFDLRDSILYVQLFIYTCLFSSLQFYIDSYIVFSNNRCVPTIKFELDIECNRFIFVLF